MRNRLIFIGALLGMILTVHLWIQQERGFDRGCLGLSAPGNTSECGAVIASGAGTLLGVSNAAWGFLFYVTLGGLTFGLLLADTNRDRLRQARFGLIVIGAGYSLYLVGYQVFSLGQYCVLCLISAGLIFLLTALVVMAYRNPEAPPDDAGSLVRGVGNYAFWAFLAGALLVADLFFVNRLGTDAGTAGSGDFREQVQAVMPDIIDEEVLRNIAPCGWDDALPEVTNYTDLFGDQAPHMGDRLAPVTIIKIFDPNCPHCKDLHEVLQPVMADYAERGWAKLYYLPVPLWDFSIDQIIALQFAEDNGQLPALIARQLGEQQPGGLSRDQIVAGVESIGLPASTIRMLLDNPNARQRAMAQQNLLVQMGTSRVPKLLFNGRFGNPPPAGYSAGCISRLLEETFQNRQNL